MSDYGKRPDGSEKGRGFLGELRSPRGDVMTEYSVGVEFDGKEVEIPSLVPTLTPDEVRAIVTTGEVPESAFQKALDHAKQRLAAGKSPFADAVESPEKPMYDFVRQSEQEFKEGYSQ